MNRAIVFGLVALALAMPPGAFAQGGRGGRGSGPKGNPTPLDVESAAKFAGLIKAVDGSKILLELPDGNIMEFRATRKTRFKVPGKPGTRKDLASGQSAEIEGRHALGAIEAVTVTVKAKQ